MLDRSPRVDHNMPELNAKFVEIIIKKREKKMKEFQSVGGGKMTKMKLKWQSEKETIIFF